MHLFRGMSVMYLPTNHPQNWEGISSSEAVKFIEMHANIGSMPRIHNKQVKVVNAHAQEGVCNFWAMGTFDEILIRGPVLNYPFKDFN